MPKLRFLLTILLIIIGQPTSLSASSQTTAPSQATSPILLEPDTCDLSRPVC